MVQGPLQGYPAHGPARLRMGVGRVWGQGLHVALLPGEGKELPGLYGYLRRGHPDAAQLAAAVERMVEAVPARHRSHHGGMCDGRLVVRNLRFLEPLRPCESLQAHPRVFLDGYLLERQALLGRLERAGVWVDPSWDDEALAGALYRRLGPAAVGGLAGSFNLCAYDPQRGEVTLISSPHGERHLYWRTGPGYFAFATEIKGLLALGPPGEVNRLALHDMFNFGYISGMQTLFADIQLLAGGTVLTATPDGVRQERYWDYVYRNTEHPEPFDDLVDEAAELLQRAVDRCLDRFGRVGIPLSGGLDSRAILAFASRRQAGLDVFHCAWYAKEEEIAAQLCHLGNGRWHRYDPLTFDAAGLLSEGMALSDGDIHCHQFWFLPVVRQVRNAQLAQALLDGYLMDVFFGDTFLVLPDRPRYSSEERRQVINRLWRRCRPGFVRQAFLPAFYREYEEANRASIEAGMAGVHEDHLSNFVQRFSLANRSNRYSVALPNVARQYVEYAYPGLDRQLTDLYLRLPPEYKAGARFYRQVLLRHAERFARVPWVKTGRPLQHDRGWLSRRLGRLPVHQLGTLGLLRLTRGRVDASHRADLNRFFRRDPAFRGALTSVLRDRRTWSRGIIDREGVERLIGFVDRGWPVLALLQSLVTVELWHRRFVDG
ncbi:MAG: asparagine synthetase B family protein [Candidatus Latescibacterota bacterium]